MTTPISSATAAPPVSPAAVTGSADAAKKSLSTNFDTFLTLLTTQLQHQDPLSPMDTNEFTQQLVQFSSVEQQISANKNLESLIALTKSRNTIDALSYLGKTVTTTDGSGALAGGQAHWSYTLDGEAASTVLMISNASGRLVAVGRGETANGTHSFTWNGKDASGNTLPDGAYTLSVHALLGDGTEVPAAVTSQGAVGEVDLSGNEPLLMIGPMGVPMSKVSRISGM